MILLVFTIASSGADPMSWSAVAVLTPVLILSGILLTWVGVKSVKGTLPRNWIAGIRTKATLTSDETWMKGHKSGGSLIVWAGIVSIISGVVLLFRPSNIFGALLVIGSMVIVAVLVVVSGVKADKVDKQISVNKHG